MKVYRIHLYSWTASFRYPNMISGYQPTLLAPPLSTINGLISAAMGKYFCLTTERLGYVFRFQTKATDLETIYQMGQSLTGIKSNVIKREFLVDNDLYLYTDSTEIPEAFRRPIYQLLLGRSGDLVRVISITELETTEKVELHDVRGTILPFKKYQAPGTLQALPVCFSDELPRRNIGTQPYCILAFDQPAPQPIRAAGIGDQITVDGQQIALDIYWQEIL